MPHSAAEHGQTERQLAERLCILPHVLAKVRLRGRGKGRGRRRGRGRGRVGVGVEVGVG